jgi:bla regulator protein blaR1
MNGLLNHLWQSSAFAVMVALAAGALRRNSPRARYWLWLAASLKFLVPFSWIVSTGARVQLPPDTPSLRALTVKKISTYFAPIPSLPAAVPLKTAFDWTPVLGAVWFGGALFLVTGRQRQWLTIRRAARGAKRLPCGRPIPVFSSSASIEPGVFGVFRPVLLVPEGLAGALTPPQFEAIIAHELRHARYRDNLTGALHMLVETVFWFHPLVWWIGARLMDERERDCDEAVLARGGSPGEYARGILQVCRRYAVSPLPCAAGIGGSDLKNRIREIMTWRGSLPLTFRGRAALAAAAAIAVSVPFVIGIVRGQSLPPAPAYAYSVVSIHRSTSASDGWGWETGPQRGLRVNNATTVELLLLAYQIPEYRLSGAPKWASSDRYDVTLTPAEPEAAEARTVNAAELARRDRNWQRLQAVLRDRFKLILRLETHELPVYALVADEKGIKLSRSADGKPSSFVGHPGQRNATAQPISRLATFLSGVLGRPVIDETKLDGQYDFTLRWDPTDSVSTATPDVTSNPLAGLSIVTALREQLGLRLATKKGPVEAFVIEQIERPSEN